MNQFVELLNLVYNFELIVAFHAILHVYQWLSILRDCRVRLTLEIIMPMARITLFWCFEKNIFLNRMMEFQVKFCHHSGLRLWRTGMLFSTKSKGHKSNVRISWMYRYCFYDLKVHFWWPNKHLKCNISSWNTLY